MTSPARGNPARWWKSRSCGGASLAPKALFISPFRRWAARLALVFLLLFVWGVLYVTSPARISRLSSALLSRVLGGNVTVRSGHLSYSGTLLLSGVEVRAADATDTPAGDIPIFTAEQIEARFDWFSLLSGQLAATQLLATTPVFQPIEDQDSGHWNFERLRPGFGSVPKASAKGLALPVIVLRDAHVKSGEILHGRLQQTGETIINGDMTPDLARASIYRFHFAQSAPPSDPTAVGPGAVIRGTWDSAVNAFNLTTENVVMNDALRNGLPRVARQWCAEHQLAGRLSRLDAAFSPQTGLSIAVNFDGVSMIWMIEPEQGIAVGEERPAYPLDLRNVRGQVVFSRDQTAAGSPSRDPNTIRITDLRGEILGYQFVVNGDVQGATADAPFAFTLQFPDANVGDRYPALFMAALSSQDLIQRMEPHGRMDILVNLRRGAPRGTVQYGGQIDLKDARLRYAHFPMPMDHVNGRLTFDQRSVTFHDVTGKADQIDVRLTGSCGTVWSNHFVDMTISSPNIIIDDRLAACLPDQYQEIWNLFSLRGRGSFVCRVTRADSMLDHQKLVVDVDLADAHGYLRASPFVFSQAAGHVHMEADQTRLEHLTAHTGADGSGRVTLDGVIRQTGDDVVHLQPELHIVADVPVDSELLHGLPEDFTSKLAGIALGGRLGFDGTIRRVGDPGAEAVQVAGNLNWKQGTLQMRFGDQPLALSGIDAQAVLSPATLDLKSLAANVDAGPQKLQLQLAGKLDIDTMSGLMRIALAGKDLALPAEAPPLFPPSWRETWRAYAPAGKIDLAADASIRVNLPANPAATQPAIRVSDSLALDGYTAHLALHDLSLKESSWPDTLSKINGKLEIIPGRITMTGMAAAMGNVTLAWDGQTDPDTGKVALSGEASSQGWPDQWLNVLPDVIAKNLDLKHPGVALTLHLDTLARPAAGQPWTLEGKLHADNLAGTGPLPMTIDTADFTGKALLTPGTAKKPAAGAIANWLAFPRNSSSTGAAFDFTGALGACNLTISNRLIETLNANIAADSARHDITISDLVGQVAGGILQGKIRIRTAGQIAASAPATAPGTLPADTTGGGYIADLVLHDAELSRLVLSENATDDERKTIGTGRVTASLSLQETFGPQADRTGRGDLVVTDGDIFNVPLSMGLMQVATLRLPVARSFQHASLSYFLRDDAITFERILLESEGINLAGLGTVSLSTREMNMSFVTETPHEFSIPILTPILNETRNELLQLSVTGTVDNPKITPVPLSAISNLLRSILPHP